MPYLATSSLASRVDHRDAVNCALCLIYVGARDAGVLQQSLRASGPARYIVTGSICVHTSCREDYAR